MPREANPGPPLLIPREECVTDAPCLKDWSKAIGAALLAVVGEAICWAAFVLAIRHTWELPMIAFGFLCGWAINEAAGRHRTIAFGVIAIASTLLGWVAGYLLLWLPVIPPGAIDRQLSWYHIVAACLAGVAAYCMAAPKPGKRSTQ